MKRTARAFAAAAILVLAASTTAVAAPLPAKPAPSPVTSASPQIIPDQFIVTLTKGGTLDSLDKLLDRFSLGIQVKFRYSGLFLGFAAKISPLVVPLLRALPEIESVTPDAEIKLDLPPANGGSARAVGSWGLDRINQRSLPLDGAYSVSRNGSGVTAYIVDTGIQFDHPDFQGRARPGFDAIGDGRNGNDCNGHGTHVAGTVGGAVYGVAKATRLVAVRVLGCDGRGSWGGIIAGLDWVGANAVRPAVANLSLGGTPGLAQVDDAANRLSDKGVFVAVAGGNSTDDACKYSPARAARPITIGATTVTDGYAGYSNRGQCIQLLAPGTDITSAWPGNQIKTISGTSMATPHVAGAAALFKQAFGDQPQAPIMNWLWNNGTPDKIGGTPAATPNRLLYTGGL
ncbi:S8 family peptidase [Crossiella cryophila]|uniref:Subtilisin family serine protease n=1 Tax=Crossiella cryophila TaxID=43355 RepID=A0A7W7FVB8_9PSEU|nr:S8 family peptidase [Crossiella cryophila]MBB4679132.1 subtilisin family serine protease [Crossiella cryophila]